MFDVREPFEKARDDLKEAASKVTEPATPIMNAILIGGLTAGLLAGAVFAWHKLRKDRG